MLACDERKNVLLMHLHPLAGCFCICTRCHAVWDDFRPTDRFRILADDPAWPREGDARSRDAVSLPTAKATPGKRERGEGEKP